MDEATYKVLRWLIIYREQTTIGQVVDVTKLGYKEAEGVLDELQKQGLVVETQGERRRFALESKCIFEKAWILKRFDNGIILKVD